MDQYQQRKRLEDRATVMESRNQIWEVRARARALEEAQ